MHNSPNAEPLAHNANEAVDNPEIKQQAAQQEAQGGEQEVQHQGATVAKAEVVPTSSAPVPRPPPPRGSLSDAPTSPRPPPPKPPLHPKPVSPEPRTSTSTAVEPSVPLKPLPPAGRPSQSFGPPPSRPAAASVTSAPPVAIRDLWMSSAREEAEVIKEGEGTSEDEGDGEEAEEDEEEEEEEEEDEEDEDGGPVDRQGRPVRSAADVKKKRGGGAATVVVAEPVAPFAFVPLDSLSFSAGVEKPKASSITSAKALEPYQENKTAPSFADTFGSSLSSFDFGGASGASSGGGFSFGAVSSLPAASKDPFAFSLFNTVTSTAVGDGNNTTGTSSFNQNGANNAKVSADGTTSSSTSSVGASTATASSAATAPATASSAATAPAFNIRSSASAAATSSNSKSLPTPKVDPPKEVKEAKYADDEEEKGGPVDRNGRPTRAATDIKKKRTPGGRNGDETKVAESDPASTLPFIFAPMHLRSSEGFAAGVDTSNTKPLANDNNNNSSSSCHSAGTTKKSQKKMRSPVALPATTSSSSYSSGGEGISFSDAVAVSFGSFGSFSFSSSSTTASDFTSPFAFRTNNNYDSSPFGNVQEHKTGFADTSFTTANFASTAPTTASDPAAANLSQTNTSETNPAKENSSTHKAEAGVPLFGSAGDAANTNEPTEALGALRRPPGPPPSIPSTAQTPSQSPSFPTHKSSTSTGSDSLPDVRNSKPEANVEEVPSEKPKAT